MLVSVFIPTYNAQELLLNEALESVLNQSYKNIEIWLVDDASTDDTPQRIDLWAKRDNRVKVIHKQHDGSVPFAWNVVIPKLNGEFTFYMSHDDIISHYCIERLVKRQKETNACCVIPSCVGFVNNYLCPEEAYSSFNKRNRVIDGEVISGKEAFFRMLDYSIPGFALWNTELIRNAGMPTESYNSDECMQRVWVSRCKTVAFDDNAKFYYRMSPSSITKGLNPYHYASLLTLRRMLTEGNLLLSGEDVTSDMVKRFDVFKQFSKKSFIYLATMFKKNKTDYSMEDSNEIKNILKDTEKAFFNGFSSLLLPLIVNLNCLRKR